MGNGTLWDGDYYALLGVGRGADEEEIRRAFRALARRLHPDVNAAPDAPARFAALMRAYATLSDAERRRAYDLAHGHGRRRVAWADSPFAGPSPFGGNGAGTGGPLGSGGRGAEGAGRFTAPFSRDRPVYYGEEAGGLARSALRGLDVHHTVHLSLADAARGATRNVVVPRREVCILCGGTGAAPEGTSRPCPTCHASGRARSGAEACLTCGGSGSVVDVPCRGCGGSGRRQGLYEVDGVRFPAGLPSVGYTRRIKGEGDPGPRGGPRGELLLHAIVDDGPDLWRAAPESADVQSEVVISPDRAARGGRLEVPTLYGRATFRVPRDVASGATFTLRGKGLRRHGRFGKGDHRVTVRVDPDAPPR